MPEYISAEAAKVKQQLLMEEINGYAKILSDRGVDVSSYDMLPEGLSVTDLSRICEHYKQLARTPTNR